MIGESLLSLTTPWGLWAGAALAALAAGIVLLRRPTVPGLTAGLALAGLLLVALGAGGLTWQRATPQPVVVMVDVSPSTRTAEYRDRSALLRRIRELLGTTPYRLQFFSEDNLKADPGSAHLADVPADHTNYAPPTAAAVLLFSDCRFALPEQSPPAYVVVDPGLEDTDDASVADLEVRGSKASVTINNAGGPRRIILTGMASDATGATAPIGSTVNSHALIPHATKVSAELSPGDPWPENDLLSAAVPSSAEHERWWVGPTSPGPDWRQMTPAQLPDDPAAYLSPAVIVLENVPASDLSDTQQQRLRQYVRDLGGGLVILGGDRAFAAGGYAGSALEAMSPLASNPPAPTTQWVVLVDASGSMAADADGSTRWKLVTDAASAVLPHLPAQDLVSVGGFAENVDWWITARPAHEARSTAIPPAESYPHGPTNLQPALEAVAAGADGKAPVELLVLSDFDAQLTGIPDLTALLKSKHVRLNLLAIGRGSALPALRHVAQATGGATLTQFDPAKWSAAARDLARAASARPLERDPVMAHFEGDASAAGMWRAAAWNRLWLKQSAAPLAQMQRNGQSVPLAARWNAGEGQALAVAFDMPPARVDALARLVARPPHDPRFRINWATGPHLRAAIDAIDGGKYLNGLRVTLELSDAFGEGNLVSYPVPQTGPGRYELEVPAPRSPGVASIRAEGQVIGRVAIAGRYAPEFDAVGNDHAAMNELARRTGGKVVLPSSTAPLHFRWPRQSFPLSSLLACAGAALVALGLGWWRLH